MHEIDYTFLFLSFHFFLLFLLFQSNLEEGVCVGGGGGGGADALH